jgi:hypothetical protein
MDEEKAGQGTSVLATIVDAAKTSMDAAIEGVSSAATGIAEAVTGGTEKPRRREKAFNHKESCGQPGKDDHQTGKGEAFRYGQTVCCYNRSQR